MEELIYKPEKELKLMAEEAAKRISIRSYYRYGANGEEIPVDGQNGMNGSSRDDWRETTAEEAEIVFNIVYAALLAVNSCRILPEAQNGTLYILETAEYTGQLFFKKFNFEVNCYDTIYCPLKHFINEWEIKKNLKAETPPNSASVRAVW